MKSAVYSTDPAAAQRLVDPQQATFYVCPKAQMPALRSLPMPPAVAVEDLTKTPTWLWCNEVLNDQSTLIYDRVSRYYRVSSEVSRRLERLAEVAAHTYLVDIIPFCEDVQYLYMPWRYVNRSILGYAHYYAFRENYAEMLPDGKIVRCHDYAHLSRKLAPSCIVERLSALLAKRQRVEIVATEAEQHEYKTLRDQLFEMHTTPQPIVTRLADYSHATPSRRETVCEIAGSFSGRVALVCNLSTYASFYHAKLSRSVVCCSYSTPSQALSECDVVVYAEPPIVQSFRFFDIESLLPPSALAIRVFGELKVDRYLDERLTKEISQVDAFTKTLWEQCHAGL